MDAESKFTHICDNLRAISVHLRTHNICPGTPYRVFTRRRICNRFAPKLRSRPTEMPVAFR